MNAKYDHPTGARLSRWWTRALVFVAVLVVIGGYRWNHERTWTLIGRDGRSICRVQQGWNEQEVFVHCGARSGRGWQPKAMGTGHGLDLQMCSAPGDVYGSKVVLYGCDGRVATVEPMPAHDFIYPSN